MTLVDQIIDEAEELVTNKVLYDPTDAQILDSLREITGVPFADNSMCAKLALAAYNRYDNMQRNIRSVVA